MKATAKFRQQTVERQNGETARLRVIQGPDVGSTYVIFGPKATIGRGEESDIMIPDLKASRVHCEIRSIQENWRVRDLGSANGVLVNGKLTADGEIRPNDVITLGESMMEFFSGDSATVAIMSPPKTINQIVQEQAGFEVQQAKVRALGNLSGPLNAIQNFNPKKSLASSGKPLPKILIGLGAAVVALFVFSENTPPPQKIEKSSTSAITADSDLARNLAQYLPNVDQSTKRSVDKFLREGLREFREKNFLRAQSQFEAVLQISPGQPLANLYLTNSKRAIEEEIKLHLENGKKSYSAGKLRSARGHFEAIERLLFRDQANPAFKEAQEELNKIDGEMKGGT